MGSSGRIVRRAAAMSPASGGSTGEGGFEPANRPRGEGRWSLARHNQPGIDAAAGKRRSGVDLVWVHMIVAILGAFAMSGGTSAAVAQTTVVAAPANGMHPSPRVRRNFNGDWRFKLGDVAAGADPALDDSDWEPTGLPHSFSLPYFQAPSFYVGYGWYRKTLQLPDVPAGRRHVLEFEGAFQTAEVFVNGTRAGQHRGGYTGFSIDISSALKAGANTIAVRVNNNWDPTLAPRAGEHVFSGGLYRDVWLVTTDAVHVAWMGTRVTTPEVSAASSRVQVETEVRNDGAMAVSAVVRGEVIDPRDRVVAILPERRVELPPSQTVTVTQLSERMSRPQLWSPETPSLYRVRTRVVSNGVERDRYETEFGFRWVSWTADKGFFLNGQHRYFRGANVHQDQAGWGDAVTNAAIERDVQMMKDAGFDFIRGSHYPHDPHFAEATDRIGMLYMSEAPFWGTAGFNNLWSSSAYPTDPAHIAAFDASVMQQLAEMIRINRNRPSIIAWSMDNEVFFTAPETMPHVRRLLQDMVALAHELDPTRLASVSGAQRGEIDRIGDVAGYNGDGAFLFPDPGIPNFVAEYGSTIADRPGEYAPGWGDLERTPGASPDTPYSWRLPWRSGEAIWAGFDHGSIAGRQFGSMGIVDYSRLPKRSWYWYRNAYLGIAPPRWPEPGRAAALRLSSSAPSIGRADGTDDVQLVVTVVDENGKAISNSPPVRLVIESGPGELPTGRAIEFTPSGDIPIRDGQAAIAMRSWQAGVSRLRASSPGLEDALLEIRTLTGPSFLPGVTPLSPDRPYPHDEARPVEAVAVDEVFGMDTPASASCTTPGHMPGHVNDGDPSTSWIACPNEQTPWIMIDPERVIRYRRLRIAFAHIGRIAFVVETREVGGGWRSLAEWSGETTPDGVVDLDTAPLTGRQFRLTLRSPPAGSRGISDIRIYGHVFTN